MPGTREGALKARDKNLAHDPDFYRTIGKQSAKNYLALPVAERPKRGFALVDKEKLKQAAAKGGRAKRHEL